MKRRTPHSLPAVLRLWVLFPWLLLCVSAGLACRDADSLPPVDPDEGVDPGGQHTSQPISPADLPFAPGPPAAVDGLDGLRAVSLCTFPGGETVRLEAVYLFPGRVRWQFGPAGEQDGRVRREYRFGSRVFGEEPGRTGSVEYAPEQRDSVLRGQALRRAVLLWPSTLAWEQTAGGRAQVDLAGVEAGTSLGSIEAQLDAQGRATRLVVRDPEGRPREALSILGWRHEGERAIPSSLELSVFQDEREVPVWIEEVERFDVQVSFVDELFLPIDRRPSAVPGPARAETVRLEAATSLELPWPPGEAEADWTRKIEVAHEALRTVRVPDGAELDPWPVVVLDREGRPSGVAARLRDAPPAPDGGWLRTPERTALTVRFASPGAFERSWVPVLMARAGDRAGTPYVRPIPRPDGGLGLQLVLPLAPANSP